MTAPLAAVPGRRWPFVVGLIRFDGKEFEATLRRDGSVRARYLSCGRVWDDLSLHEVADWLRLQVEASA